MHLNVWIVCEELYHDIICSSVFFCFPPGRLSLIISTFRVCKAGAPWGILCPVHPLLSWGLCSSRHLAPPVQPLCRCQLPCTCPRPLLQPVYQPGLYSRYSFIYKAAYPDINQAHPIQLTDCNRHEWISKICLINVLKMSENLKACGAVDPLLCILEQNGFAPH